jgi:hypothetical protein
MVLDCTTDRVFDRFRNGHLFDDAHGPARARSVADTCGREPRPVSKRHGHRADVPADQYVLFAGDRRGDPGAPGARRIRDLFGINDKPEVPVDFQSRRRLLADSGASPPSRAWRL